MLDVNDFYVCRHTLVRYAVLYVPYPSSEVQQLSGKFAFWVIKLSF